MIVLLQDVLTADQVAAILADLGRGGDDEAVEARHEIHGGTIVSSLISHEPFSNAILPTAFAPFQFDRRAPDSVIQERMDNPLSLPGSSNATRIDVVCVTFLSDPADYDGGELIIDSSSNPTPVKLAAGSAVIFPATDFYTMGPVTRGESWIARCGVQSAIRGTREREILTEIWTTMNDFKSMQPTQGSRENDGVKILGRARSNLIRLLANS